MTTTRTIPARRRGLTLLELLFAMTVTAMVGMAITGMLHVVTTGVLTHRDVRATMIRASAAQSRLGAYIAPCRAVLAASEGDLVLWQEDSRQSDTVHASEIRWLLFDEVAGTIEVHAVRFPDAWSEVARALEDVTYAAGSDWPAVLAFYEAKGWTSSLPLVDGLVACAVAVDDADPLASRHVVFDLQFAQDTAPIDVQVAATVSLHDPPG